MAKLNQLLAVVKTRKADTQKAIAFAHHLFQKRDQFTGLSRVYQPREDGGETLPPESKRVTHNAVATLHEVKAVWGRLFELTGTIDATNCMALATISVDGQDLVTNVPVTHLLWLEKQLADLITMIKGLPTLDPQYVWTKDAATGQYATEVRATTRSKKIPRNHVKAPATDKHPAQVEVYHEDQIVGEWHTRDLSSAFRQDDVTVMLGRAQQVLDAVKKAREEANMVTAIALDTSRLLDYIIQ